jgi:titin
VNLLVNTTGDAADANLADGFCQTATPGECSLRAAIQQSNRNAGANVIEFDIPSGSHTIMLTAALPAITDTVMIDGWSEPAFAGTPIVELDGSGAGANVPGLWLRAGSSTIRGLVVGNFSGPGILVDTAGSNTIVGMYIGVDAGGTAATPNDEGIRLSAGNNTIGGLTPGERNVISGNTRWGIRILAPNNRVLGNYIGTDSAGMAALGNGYSAIQIQAATNRVGGTAPGARNILSGNGENGLLIRDGGGLSNIVEGNYIGLSAVGTALPNSRRGVEIINGAANNVIGGAAAGARNIISANGSYGVRIDGAASNGNRVQGNYIGTDVSGTTALGNLDYGISVSFTSAGAQIGGSGAGEGNLVSGNLSDGIHILQANSTIVQGNRIGVSADGSAALPNLQMGVAVQQSQNVIIGGTTAAMRNLISGNQVSGVYLGAGTISAQVLGNYIGTDVNGAYALANRSYGVEVDGATGSSIGGSALGAGNLISGNGNHGIVLANGATAISVYGNLIGTDAAGNAALGNTGSGVYIQAAANQVGGTSSGQRNIISGNSAWGVYLDSSASANNRVQGNYIGLNSSGNGALGNTLDGIGILGGSGNLIGGDVAGAGNVIAGQTVHAFSDGIWIKDGSSNIVQGNLIGTSADGSAAIANSRAGIVIERGLGNQVGGVTPGAGNLISANGSYGITINSGASGTVVLANKIGVDASGTLGMPNALGGIQVAAAPDTIIGNDSAAGENVIAFNQGAGIVVSGTSIRVSIGRNAIFNNAGLGIDLNGDGVTLNDGATSAAAPNNGQDFPVITGLSFDGTQLSVSGYVGSSPGQAQFGGATVRFFVADNDPGGYGEGARYLGSLTADASGMFSGSFPASALVSGDRIAALATDPAGSSSEFGAVAILP